MKSILVPIENPENMNSILETVLLLARRWDSYIEGFALRFRVSESMAIDTAGIGLESYHNESLEEAAKAAKMFESFMEARNVPRATAATKGLSFGWLEDAPEGENFVGSYGRVFDITVLSRPDDGSIGLHHRAIESALFESGRLVLLAPPMPPTEIATNIMVHWNGSTEQARTTEAAMPLLRQASRVTVLNVVRGQGVAGPSAKQLCRYLERNGIQAGLLSVELEGRSTGEAVLQAAAAADSDLLVKGAYTQSRLRQMIFGGTTRHILAHAELPVLMAH